MSALSHCYMLSLCCLQVQGVMYRRPPHAQQQLMSRLAGASARGNGDLDQHCSGSPPAKCNSGMAAAAAAAMEAKQRKRQQVGSSGAGHPGAMLPSLPQPRSALFFFASTVTPEQVNRK